MENEHYNKKEEMKTLAACINSLAKEGFETQFKVINKFALKSLSTQKLFTPEDVRIESFYRFEGESDPADNCILYAIETWSGEKGTLVDAYGVYADSNVSGFIKSVEEITKRPQAK